MTRIQVTKEVAATVAKISEEEETTADTVERLICEAGYESEIVGCGTDDNHGIINADTRYYRVLCDLPADGEWRTTKELAEFVADEVGSGVMLDLSSFLGDLERRGAVEKRTAIGDARSNEWRVTEYGREVSR